MCVCVRLLLHILHRVPELCECGSYFISSTAFRSSVSAAFSVRVRSRRGPMLCLIVSAPARILFTSPARSVRSLCASFFESRMSAISWAESWRSCCASTADDTGCVAGRRATSAPVMGELSGRWRWL